MNMNEAKVLIRGATADDATGILEAHRAAVFGTARFSYPQEILEAWAAIVDSDTTQQLALRITTRAELVAVADAAGEIAGFGSVAPKTSELLAVYVAPIFELAAKAGLIAPARASLALLLEEGPRVRQALMAACARP
jgi:hypothetical protein